MRRIGTKAMTGAERVRLHRERARAVLPVNKIIAGHAATVMARWPAGCIDLIVTSPPYWTAVQYGKRVVLWATYETYLAEMLRVWVQCARVLRPNGKLCINAMMLPISARVDAGADANLEEHSRRHRLFDCR
jgi:hypothetical protein